MRIHGIWRGKEADRMIACVRERAPEYPSDDKLGATEGVELHLFGMAFGIDLWPPAFIVPIGPGRRGFEDR